MFQLCEKIWINVQLASFDPISTLAYGLLPNQALGVSQGVIHCIAPMATFEQESSQLTHSQILDVQGALLTPGLIDCHTHLIHAGNRAQEFEQRLLGTSYEQIAQQGGGILSTVRATRNTSVEQLIELAVPRLKALITEGITTIEIKSGYGLDLGTELKMLQAARELAKRFPVRVSTTLLGAHALPPEYKHRADAYVDWICAELLPAAVAEHLADAVDVFCEHFAFNPTQTERILQTAQAHSLGIHVHAEQLSNQQAATLAVRYHAWSADHLEWLDETGVAAMAESGTVATLLPTAFYFLRETKVPPIELLRRYQVPMAVATDFNPGTAPLASIRLAMNMACTLFRLTPEEALMGVTRHAAQALGLQNQIGQLRNGFAADFIVWDIQHPAELAYQVGINPIKQRVFAGEITYV
ncbi:imidazolonepropionase [uncultured Thiothrix sp.]|mgnify:CR=1 FL=1|uniref:imidazolonepropionase n=1 Tax=uncultured Thiothrix sp. TaxID=223185 RepID=UPI00262C9A31|nr:imidazolonepropionase [uncultured Thiothrix sp.]HMT93339.1 imidazolonepropionase [Thiolinea sp.]